MNGKKFDFLYTGNWDHITGSPGIGLFWFYPENGSIEFKEMLDIVVSCGNICMDPENAVIYIANEVPELPGEHGGGGSILSYRIDRETGRLSLLCEARTLCPNPSYISFDSEKKYLVVSNHSAFGTATRVHQDENGDYYTEVSYDDATVDLFERKEDGSIGKLLHVVKHDGAGKKPRQFHPHPHSAVKSPLWDLFAVCDKGNDCIYFYNLDKKEKKLELCPDMPYRDIPGSSPRYGVFHPEKPWFFCNHEGEGFLHVFTYTEQGSVELAHSVKVLPEGWETADQGRCEQQDLKISDCGHYIYTLFHGTDHDGVSVFYIGGSGKPELIQTVRTKGVWPRGCAFSADGKYLLVGCMVSGTIEVYSVGEDGMLSFVSECRFLPGISCMAMFEGGGR